MFDYYLTLALRSLKRNGLFSVLMVLAIGVGIGASMTMLTILRAATGDPLPHKSARLLVPQLDNFGPAWLLRSVALTRLPPVYLMVGTVLILALGQLAALWPALRAAAVPPALAARGA